MKISAGNQLSGTVSVDKAGAVNDEVEISLPGVQRIVRSSPTKAPVRSVSRPDRR